MSGKCQVQRLFVAPSRHFSLWMKCYGNETDDRFVLKTRINPLSRCLIVDFFTLTWERCTPPAAAETRGRPAPLWSNSCLCSLASSPKVWPESCYFLLLLRLHPRPPQPAPESFSPETRHGDSVRSTKLANTEHIISFISTYDLLP